MTVLPAIPLQYQISDQVANLQHMKTQLELLLERLSTAERDKLIGKLGVDKSTYYRWLENPGKRISVDAAVVIKAFLDRRDKEDYNMAKLVKPVRIAA